MSLLKVQKAIIKASTDNLITRDEITEIQAAAGKTISPEEHEAMDTFVESLCSFYDIPEGELQFADRGYVKFSQFNSSYRFLVKTYEEKKEMIENRSLGLDTEAREILTPEVSTSTFGGTTVPEEVKIVLNKALAAGAKAYDVEELIKPEQELKESVSEDGNHQIKTGGKFTPYPQTVKAVGTMSFQNTEVTPQKLIDDMNTLQDFTQLSGYQNIEFEDRHTGEVRIRKNVPQYKKVTAKGTGNISAHYDKSKHHDLNARGMLGQKWANNFAILADGSLHALPAMRRMDGNPSILINSSLARGKKMLFNGHIEIREGVVQKIGMSGRLHKLAAKGQHKFIDPLPILKAWGFEIKSGLQTELEGDIAKHGLPERDLTHGTIGSE